MSARDRVQQPLPVLDSDLVPAERHDEHEVADISALARNPRRRDRGRAVRRSLAAADLTALVTAFVALQFVFPAQASNDRLSLDSEAILFAASLPVWVVLARAMGLYDRDAERPEHTTVDDLVGIVSLVTTVIWLSFVVAFVTGSADPDFGKWVVFWALAIVLIAVARSIVRMGVLRRSALVQRALIVGTDRNAQLVARKLLQHPEYGISLVGFVDASPTRLREEVAEVPVLAGVEQLPTLVEQNGIDRVVFGFSGATERQMLRLVRQLQSLGVQVDLVPRLFEALGPNANVTSIEAMQLVSLPPTRMNRDALLLKRAFDVMGSALLLVLLSPFLAAIAVWIKLDSPGPVLFRQIRLGFDQRPFTALKFRTMRSDTSSVEHRAYVQRAMSTDTTPEEGGLYKLERPDVVTRAGQFLRRTSLDELPQLWNILRGDMSLVGPRPCIPYETEVFEEHHFERFSVPAGLTGLWQVTARAHSPFVEALELDVLYARSRSFRGDLSLLLKTPVQIVRPKATR
ncbi:MAG TPA: sugar transferase [Gaiella sp.]|nr:sugar transferase [Gaiella sp.]